MSNAGCMSEGCMSEGCMGHLRDEQPIAPDLYYPFNSFSSSV